MSQHRDSGHVVVTGVSGRLGRMLTQQLHRVRPVLGIDRRPFVRAPRDVQMHRIDIRSRRCEEVFRTNRIDAVIHLNIMHDPMKAAAAHHEFNIMGTQQVLEYCLRYGVRKFVFLSTADLYGSGPRTMRYLREDAPLLGAANFSNMRDLIEVDMLCTSFLWQHPEVESVVLRPVHICGKVHNAPSSYLRLSKLPRLSGFDPMIQVIHTDDVVRALIAVLEPGARGVYNVTGPEPTPLSAILDLLGKPVIDVPSFVLEPLMRRMYKARLWNFPPSEVDHLRYGCMVDGSRIRSELGFAANHGLEEIVSAFRDRSASLYA